MIQLTAVFIAFITVAYSINWVYDKVFDALYLN
jgi:hypothetical protein